MRFTAWLGAATLAVCMVSVARMPEVYAKDAESKPKAKAKPKPKATPPPKQQTRRNDCVKLVEAPIDDVSFTLELKSTCKVSRECTLKFAVTCEGSEPSEHEEAAWIEPGGSQTWTASAAHCGDAAFVISAPRFACKAPPRDAAAK